MLKLMCGLFVVIFTVSGSFAFGEVEVQLDPMVSLPTFRQMMLLSPKDRRDYLEVVQHLLVAMAEQSELTGSGLIAESEEQKTTIARYNMILALLQTVDSEANAADSTAPAPVRVGDPCGGFLGIHFNQTCKESANNKCTVCNGFPGAGVVGNVARAVGINTDMGKPAKPEAAHTTQQAVAAEDCSPDSQKMALKQNRSSMKNRIFAGWVLPYAMKRPPSTYCPTSVAEMDKGPVPCPKDQAITCKVKDAVMCNPFAYGTASATEGICISPPFAKASENCMKESAKHKNDKPAYDFLAQGKGPMTEAWQKYAKDFNSICTYAKGGGGNIYGQAMGVAKAQCSECKMMATAMKSLNTHYKDQLFKNDTDILNTDMKVDPASPSGPSASPIPGTGKGATTSH